jgi:hypothetical protein
MLATAIGVDGEIEADVRRLVAGQDAPGLLFDDLGPRREMVLGGHLIQRTPAVVMLLALILLEAMRNRPGTAAALERLGADVERRCLNWRLRGMGLGRHTVVLYSISRRAWRNFLRR